MSRGIRQWDLFSQSRAATPSSTRIPAISHHPTQLLQYQQQQQHHLSLSGSASLPSLPTSSTTFAQFALPSGGVPSAGSAPMNPNFASTSASTLPRSPAPIVPLASSKSLRSKKTHLSPIKQTPLIPNFIFDRIVTYVSRVKGLTGKKDVVSSVCRYWSLKREGRTGAPLLKRIHLEVRFLFLPSPEEPSSTPARALGELTIFVNRDSRGPPRQRAECSPTRIELRNSS